MKKIIIFTVLVVGAIFCKSQTITLKQLSECQADLYPCPNYTNAKDVTNSLAKFAGTWKGSSIDGRKYEFHFTKKEDDGGWLNEKFWDILIGRLIVIGTDGSVLANTLNTSDAKTHFEGYFFNKDLTKYQLYYSGNAECNDKGYVYLSFPDPNNLNQMKLVFMQEPDIIASCPDGYKTVMPDAKAIMLAKQ